MDHHNALLVALSYVIGFTTAFIAFGVSDLENNSAKFYPSPHVVKINASKASVANTSNQIPVVIQNEAGLFYAAGDEEMIISAHVESNPGHEPGGHVSVYGVAASPDGRYIHFCEQYTEVPTECSSFVYVAGQHVVKPVKQDGQHLVSSIEGLAVSWTDDNNLQINTASSASPSTPWYLSN